MNATPGSATSPMSQPNHSLHTLASVASGRSRDTTAPKEVSAVNHHTKNVEFYGSSSSMSLLSRVQENQNDTSQPQHSEGEASLVSQLHNPGFFSSRPEVENRLEATASNTASYNHQCRGFLDGFFGSIHYIHPIIDKASFLQRCERLWANDAVPPDQTFMALYYSLLSLGALVGSRDEDNGSISNIEWSRKFFRKARTICSELSMTTDLEMVQCFFFMVRSSTNLTFRHSTNLSGQNMSKRTESSLWVQLFLFDDRDILTSYVRSVSYMYTGLAVRTALAMGINREPPPDCSKDTALLKAESRTWW